MTFQGGAGSWRGRHMIAWVLLLSVTGLVAAADFPSGSQSQVREADAALDRGLALARDGRLEEARKVFADGRKRYPGDKRFALQLAGVAYRAKDRQAAKSHLHQALRLDGLDEYGNEFLGAMYLLDGNLPAALKYWNRIGKPVLQTVRWDPEPALDPILQARAIAVSGGQVFTRDRLERTETNVRRLNVFSSYRLELAAREDERFDFTVRSVPISQPLRGRAGRILPYVRSLPYQAIHVDRHNLGEKAINFASIWRWDPDKRRIAAHLAGPIGLKPEWRYTIFADLRDEDWDLSTTYAGPQPSVERLLLRKATAGADLGFGLTARLLWTTGLDLTRRGLRGGDEAPLFNDGWSFGQRNRLDYLLAAWPERSIRVDAWGQLRTGRVFAAGASKFAITEGGLRGTWAPAGKESSYAAMSHFRAGRTFGRVPFDEFFMMGMERDHDLWFRGIVGTRDGRKGAAPLGTDYALFQVELDRTLARFPFLRLEAGPFFDAGWIRDPSGRFGFPGWIPATGVQAKVRTLGGVTWSLTYGRDLRAGSGAFYTGVFR